MPRVKIPQYNVFKNEVFNEISSDEKNFLFYWSLIDASGWFEEAPYYPKVAEGHKKVVRILKKSSQIKEIINSGNVDKFCEIFVEKEYLANYILGAELELKLGSSWVLDVASLQRVRRTEFPDITLKKGELAVSIEIKGKLSTADLRDRIKDEVKPHLRGNDYDNFILLLLFLVCSEIEKPVRVSQLIKGYYVYEDFIKKRGKKRQVFCQCFTDVKEMREHPFTLENLVERIIEGYFEKHFGELEEV